MIPNRKKRNGFTSLYDLNPLKWTGVFSEFFYSVEETCENFGVKVVKSVISLISIGVLVACQPTSEEPRWFLKATYHESCSCNAPCPCPFGLPMTNSYCKLNSLLDIQEGRYQDTKLNGVQVILSGSVGKWGEYYFSESTTDEQKAAVEQILNVVNIGHFDSILTSKKEKIYFKNEGGAVAFSTPNIDVRMNMVKGNGDQPIVIKNLKGKLFENYIPHFSSFNSRSFPDSTHNFLFESKAGFISYWNLTDSDFK